MKQDGITRGPWTIEGPDQFGDFNIHHPADRLAIGAVVSNLRPSEEVAANAHFIVAACNAYEPMREALENARALWGHRCFDTPQLTWLAQVDAALSTLPVIDRQTSDDVGILRALLEEELVWHEERDKSLSKQPQSNQTVWRRAEHQERIDVIRAALKGVPQPASNEPDDLEPGKLRPCPFCGGEAERIDFDENDDEPENIGGSAITCKRCKCSTAVVFGYKETLFSSWNERAPANAQPASEAGKLSTDTDAAN